MEPSGQWDTCEISWLMQTYPRGKWNDSYKPSVSFKGILGVIPTFPAEHQQDKHCGKVGVDFRCHTPLVQPFEARLPRARVEAPAQDRCQVPSFTFVRQYSRQSKNIFACVTFSGEDGWRA